jgi:UrcA family protein
MFARKVAAFAALALTAVAASASSASAQEREDQSVLVRFADLDLSRPSGLARLDVRLRSAASQVCNSGGRDARSLSDDRDCRARALSGARTKVAALVEGRNGRTEVALRR